MRLKLTFLGLLAALMIVALFSYSPPDGQDITTAEPKTSNDNPTSGQRTPPNATVEANDEPDNDQAFAYTPEPDAPKYAKKSTESNPQKTVIINNKEYPLITYKPAIAVNDPSGQQWWVGNARLNEAWDTPRGSHQTILAVIDTGFGLNHEEFSNRWFENSGEIGPATLEAPSKLNCSDRGLSLSASCNLIDDDRDGIVDNETGAAVYQNPSQRNCSSQSRIIAKDCNLIDDDNNGHVDDVRGWDFINNDRSAQAGELNPAGPGTTHGTRVAGIAAATGNNAKGIAGVDWGTKILPIQALDDDAYGDTLSVGQAIFYAAEMGADVISLSLGSVMPDPYVQEAIAYAIASGSVVVAAAGNDGCNCMLYPANYPEVVAVGALTSANAPAGFSSWGANLDVLAPGTNMTSPTWTSANGTSAYVSGINGTSFAAPLVSGLLTRLLSQQPSAKPLQLIASVTENTDRLSMTATQAHSHTLGYGKVDGARATTRMSQSLISEGHYVFTPVSLGAHYRPASPSEPASEYSVISCNSGTYGGTPIYELSRSGSQFFTISAAEAAAARSGGHSSSIFARACLQQPHDLLTSLRSINLFSEFRNIYRPL